MLFRYVVSGSVIVDVSAFLIPDPVFVTIPYPGCRGQIGKKIRDGSGTIPSTIGPKKV